MNTKIRSRCLKTIVALVGALPAVPVLIAAAVVGVATPAAHAANGQCKWEGGSGQAGGYAYCGAEDCVGEGGLAQCSAGEPAVSPSYSDSQVGSDKWVYGTCDETAPYIPNIARWCTSAGGQWISTPSLQCINLPSGFLGGAGTASNSEQLAVATSDTWIGSTCGQPTDTGWGGSFSSQWCVSGPNVVKQLNIPIHEARQRVYQTGPTCSSTFAITLTRNRSAKCPAGYKSRTAVTGPQCYSPAECCATRTGARARTSPQCSTV